MALNGDRPQTPARLHAEFSCNVNPTENPTAMAPASSISSICITFVCEFLDISITLTSAIV